VDGVFTSVLCKYREFEAWCCVGELTKRQEKGIEEELQRKRDSLTEPKCEHLTCNRHISLLSESAATLRRWDDVKEAKLQDRENAEVASDQLIRFIGTQELGFEQCLALERCIDLVNDYRADVARGDKPEPFKNVAEQKIKVDLHSWESAATLEELSRAAGIEPSGEFDTEGWIAEYLREIGFTSPIQSYEEVKEKNPFDAEPAQEREQNKTTKQALKKPSPLDFHDLTPDKGKWIQAADFAKQINSNTKILENRRLLLDGCIFDSKKKKGIDSRGRKWKKEGMPMKNGEKSTKKEVCYYWITHEELNPPAPDAPVCAAAPR